MWWDRLFSPPGTGCSMKAPPFPLSSRAKPRDLQFRGPFLETFFDRAIVEVSTKNVLNRLTLMGLRPGQHSAVPAGLN
jgi:hypothetical protein